MELLEDMEIEGKSQPIPRWIREHELRFQSPQNDPQLTATFVAGQAVSTDDTNDLPTPTGVGLEFVITAAGLDDIRFDGVSL